MEELVKPNEVENESQEMDYYCETKNSCNWGNNNSLEEEDEILF